MLWRNFTPPVSACWTHVKGLTPVRQTARLGGDSECAGLR